MERYEAATGRHAVLERSERSVDDPRPGSVTPASSQTGSSPASSANSISRPRRILVVDDEQLIADTLVRILNLSGFSAQAAYSGDAALATLATVCPDIVLTDVSMPGRNGIETGHLIRRQCPRTRIVLFSGQAHIDDLLDRSRGDGQSFELWPKPIHPRELVRRLREL
jgi:CheY-like chemotaxis protein